MIPLILLVWIFRLVTLQQDTWTPPHQSDPIWNNTYALQHALIHLTTSLTSVDPYQSYCGTIPCHKTQSLNIQICQQSPLQPSEGNPNTVYMVGPHMHSLHGLTIPSHSIVTEIPGHSLLKYDPISLLLNPPYHTFCQYLVMHVCFRHMDIYPMLSHLLLEPSLLENVLF